MLSLVIFVGVFQLVLIPTTSRVKNRDKDDTYVGILSDLFQLSVTATGTRLRPIAGMILEVVLEVALVEGRKLVRSCSSHVGLLFRVL